MKNIALLTLLFLTSCAAIPGNNIKLENYPDVKKDEFKKTKIDFSFEKTNEEAFNIAVLYNKASGNKFIQNRNFNSNIKNHFDKYDIYKDKNNAKCFVKIYSKNDDTLDGICGPYYFVTFFTAFIVPYYCPYNYKTHATLISTRDNRILKEYDMKDKVHEIWSSLWALSWFIYEPKFAKTPEYAKEKTKEKLSEALVRAVLNDAAKFEECKK